MAVDGRGIHSERGEERGRGGAGSRWSKEGWRPWRDDRGAHSRVAIATGRRLPASLGEFFFKTIDLGHLITRTAHIYCVKKNPLKTSTAATPLWAPPLSHCGRHPSPLYLNPAPPLPCSCPPPPQTPPSHHGRSQIGIEKGIQSGGGLLTPTQKSKIPCSPPLQACYPY